MDASLPSLPPPRLRAKKKNAPAVFKLRRISSTFGGPSISSPTSSTHSSLTPPASPIRTASPPSPLCPRSPSEASSRNHHHANNHRRLSIASTSHTPLDEYPLQTATFGPLNDFHFPSPFPTTHHQRRSAYYPQPHDTIQRYEYVSDHDDDNNNNYMEEVEVETFAVEMLQQEQPLPTRPLVHTPAIWTSSISALEERQEEDDEELSELYADLTCTTGQPSSSPYSLRSPTFPRILTPPVSNSNRSTLTTQSSNSRPTSPTLSTFSQKTIQSSLITARTSSLTSASMSVLAQQQQQQQQQRQLRRKSSATSSRSQALSLHSIKAFVLGNGNNSSNRCSTAYQSNGLSPTTPPSSLTNTAQPMTTPPGNRHKKSSSAVSAASFFSALSISSASSSSSPSSLPSSRASTPRPTSTQLAKVASRPHTPPTLPPPLTSSSAPSPSSPDVPPTSPTKSPIFPSLPASPRSPISTASKWSAEDPFMSTYHDSSSHDLNDVTSHHAMMMKMTPTTSALSEIDTTNHNVYASAKARGKKMPRRQRNECKFCSFFRIC